MKRRNIWCVNNSLTCRNVFRSRAVGGNSDLCETFFKHAVEFKGETLFLCQSKGGGRCMVDVLPVLKNKKPSYVQCANQILPTRDHHDNLAKRVISQSVYVTKDESLDFYNDHILIYTMQPTESIGNDWRRGCQFFLNVEINSNDFKRSIKKLGKKQPHVWRIPYQYHNS